MWHITDLRGLCNFLASKRNFDYQWTVQLRGQYCFTPVIWTVEQQVVDNSLGKIAYLEKKTLIYVTVLIYAL